MEEEVEIIPIEALAPDVEEAVDEPEQPSEQPMPADDGGWDLAASYALYEELRARVIGAPVAISQPRAIPTPPAAPELPLVDISELLYRGRAALERADQVQRAIRSAVSAAKPMTTIQPMVDELLDLVELAIAD